MHQKIALGVGTAACTDWRMEWRNNCMSSPSEKEQARKLQATLEGCTPKLCPPMVSLTGVKCRATSVAKNLIYLYWPIRSSAVRWGGTKASPPPTWGNNVSITYNRKVSVCSTLCWILSCFVLLYWQPPTFWQGPVGVLACEKNFPQKFDASRCILLQLPYLLYFLTSLAGWWCSAKDSDMPGWTHLLQLHRPSMTSWASPFQDVPLVTFPHHMFPSYVTTLTQP